MANLVEVELNHPALTFHREIPATKRTKKVTGNVTVINEPTPGSPEHYRAVFMIDVEHENAGATVRNVFHFTVAVQGGHEAEFRSLHQAAVNELGPMLRSLGDYIESAYGVSGNDDEAGI